MSLGDKLKLSIEEYEKEVREELYQVLVDYPEYDNPAVRTIIETFVKISKEQFENVRKLFLEIQMLAPYSFKQ
jgi:hypothetical protein